VHDAAPVKSVTPEHDCDPSVNESVSFGTGPEVSPSTSVPLSVTESW